MRGLVHGLTCEYFLHADRNQRSPFIPVKIDRSSADVLDKRVGVSFEPRRLIYEGGL